MRKTFFREAASSPHRPHVILGSRAYDGRFPKVSGIRTVLVLVFLTLTGCTGKREAAVSPKIDLAHGRLQVERMLRDRPVMRNLIQEDDELYRWAVRQYAGERLGTRIEWDPKEVGYSGSSSLRYEGRATIFIGEFSSDDGHDRGEKPFVALWNDFIFETQDIENVERRRVLKFRVISGQIPRNEFVLEYARLDFQARWRAREVILTVWKRWSTGKLLNQNLAEWYEKIPPNFEQWMLQFKDQNGYPWADYGAFWDRNFPTGTKSLPRDE